MPYYPENKKRQGRLAHSRHLEEVGTVAGCRQLFHKVEFLGEFWSKSINTFIKEIILKKQIDHQADDGVLTLSKFLAKL